ncbi:MAG: pyrroline-5-carboxylate reductase, partial [Deltaproteobacteria bacterium]|nr:pyrroline-5-carboxylate reductase [Deltaproteobacteria bacterium]
TTIHGVAILESGGMRGMLMDAVEAATRRSEELGKK